MIQGTSTVAGAVTKANSSDDRERVCVVIDPVCGAQIDGYNATASVIYRGATYYFCSRRCHGNFTSSPARYHLDIPGA